MAFLAADKALTMKVVLFCGGLGLRLREYSHQVPKPMVPVGPRPLLWHVMKYYAHFGHKEFIICLGHRGEAIKRYFLEYSEALGNNFTFRDGGRTLELESRDIADWTITFVDTGMRSNVGERLRRVQSYVEDEELFLANYSDGLTDLPLDRYLAYARQKNRIGCFLATRPNASFHAVKWRDGGVVSEINPIRRGTRINCGYFVFKPEIFRYLEPGEDLVVEPFHRLIEQEELVTYEYLGFWECADTFKDKIYLDQLFERGEAPWMVWSQAR